MPVANNSAELEKMIMDQVQKAMQATQVKIKADMLKETQAFYSQGSPILYTRTDLRYLPHFGKNLPSKVLALSC